MFLPILPLTNLFHQKLQLTLSELQLQPIGREEKHANQQHIQNTPLVLAKVLQHAH